MLYVEIIKYKVPASAWLTNRSTQSGHIGESYKTVLQVDIIVTLLIYVVEYLPTC